MAGASIGAMSINAQGETSGARLRFLEEPISSGSGSMVSNITLASASQRLQVKHVPPAVSDARARPRSPSTSPANVVMGSRAPAGLTGTRPNRLVTALPNKREAPLRAVFEFDKRATGAASRDGRRAAVPAFMPPVGAGNQPAPSTGPSPWTGPSNGNATHRLTTDGFSAADAALLIEATRAFVRGNGVDPAAGFGRIVNANALTILGEAHDQNGRFLTSSLIKETVSNGANVLFIEAGPKDQAKLDTFMRTGDVAALPAQFGGGKRKAGEEIHIYEQDYVKALQYAREHGVKLVAVDQENSLNHSAQERNVVMAANIGAYFAKNPAAKGVFIVGQGHMTGARGSETVQALLAKSEGIQTAQVYRESNDDVVSSGRSIAYASDTATAVVLEVNQNKPVMLPANNNPVESRLPNKHPGDPASSYVIYYPYVNLPQ